MENTYNKSIEILISNKDEDERIDLIIKAMAKLTNDLLDYRYMVNNYKGDSQELFSNKMDTIKNAIAVLEGELDIYKAMNDITEKTRKRKEQRIIKLAVKKSSNV